MSNDNKKEISPLPGSVEDPTAGFIDKAAIALEQGAEIAAQRAGGINLNMNKFHYHTHFEIYFLEGGERHHIIGQNEYVAEPGDFIIFAPYVQHYSFSEDPVKVNRVVLYFTENALMSPALLERLKQATGMYHPTAPVYRMIRSYLNQILMEQDAPGELHEEMMEAELNMLLLQILRFADPIEATPQKSRISQIIEYLDDHFREDLKLSDIASHFYISEYYLCHEFRKNTNTTVNQYINNARILNAQRLIMESDWNFTRIAGYVGFASLTHFNRTFKAVTGMTPSQFRKTVK